MVGEGRSGHGRGEAGAWSVAGPGHGRWQGWDMAAMAKAMRAREEGRVRTVVPTQGLY
jgi:hypothetical protein